MQYPYIVDSYPIITCYFCNAYYMATRPNISFNYVNKNKAKNQSGPGVHERKQISPLECGYILKKKKKQFTNFESTCCIQKTAHADQESLRRETQLNNFPVHRTIKGKNLENPQKEKGPNRCQKTKLAQYPFFIGFCHVDFETNNDAKALYHF